MTQKVDSISHEQARRINIPTAEYQSIMQKGDLNPVQVSFVKRDHELDPQLIWRGKDIINSSDLSVLAPPLYIQEKIHPKVLVDDLVKQSKSVTDKVHQPDLFGEFNGLPSEEAKTDFYKHEGHWSNRLILGDALRVMTSLLEKEGLKNSVQTIFVDPPYGIKFNSNFQWSVNDNDVKDGKLEHITREPEQVRAFRDTWKDGVHSYLTYLRDRLIVSKELLKDSGSIFVQIGDENIHRVRCLLDEVFGEENYVSTINFSTTSGFTSSLLSRDGDSILWYSKNIKQVKYRPLYKKRIAYQEDKVYKSVHLPNNMVRNITVEERFNPNLLPKGSRVFMAGDTSSQGASKKDLPFNFRGKDYLPSKGRHWTVGAEGMKRWDRAGRIQTTGNYLRVRRYAEDNPLKKLNSNWDDTGTGSFTDKKVYVVQTNTKVVQRCILMTSDPGDLVVDPTCGSGTTAYVCEQWGRRWITIDTSRVALALARTRLMTARFPYYLLEDSVDGKKFNESKYGVENINLPLKNDIRHGFVYERVPKITLKSIAQNSEIDVIWDSYEDEINKHVQDFQKEFDGDIKAWEIPLAEDKSWPASLKKAHKRFIETQMIRDEKIRNSISLKAEYELLFDQPHTDKSTIRVTGPFTVESDSPHRILSVDENDDIIQDNSNNSDIGRSADDFVSVVLDNLAQAGVHQSSKEDKLDFSSIEAWPGDLIVAEGQFENEDGEVQRAGIFVGPEFGTVSKPDLVMAAREAGDADFDVLICCAFNYDAHSADFQKLGRIKVLKSRINADMHMSDDLKNNGKGNLFVIFGEPDISIDVDGDQASVTINGVDVFHPNSGEVRSDGPEGIACWFIDTDYNGESFFVRQAYFLGKQDSLKALRTSLKSEVSEEAWEALNSTKSREFKIPESKRIAVKVINHLGDEVMKVYKVE